MPTKLYVLPGSHPCSTAELMLRFKGIQYKRVDFTAAHKPLLRALGFPGTTFPALRIDGRRVQGSRRISRALDEIRREPPLFPADPDRRAAVEEAERWGEEVLQPIPRRLAWWAMTHNRSDTRSFLEGARLGIPAWLAARTSRPVIRLEVRINKADDEAMRADLAALSPMLDRVDAWIAEGLIGAAEPNAADFQVATSVRLLMCFDDLREEVSARPAGDFAMRVCPRYPGRVRSVFHSSELRTPAPA